MEAFLKRLFVGNAVLERKIQKDVFNLLVHSAGGW